ncbi:MAG: VOC family protein, partial [Cyanobacteria bacterium J06555_12]
MVFLGTPAYGQQRWVENWSNLVNEGTPQLVSQQPAPLEAVIEAKDNLEAVVGVSITVSDMDEALAFYTEVLPFEKMSDVEVLGTEYEQLQGIFGVRARIARLQLGQETIELVDYLTPGGRPVSVDSAS